MDVALLLYAKYPIQTLPNSEQYWEPGELRGSNRTQPICLLIKFTVALALQYDDNNLVVAHFSVTQLAWNLHHSKVKMSAWAWKLSSSISLEAPTIDVNSASLLRFSTGIIVASMIIYNYKRFTKKTTTDFHNVGISSFRTRTCIAFKWWPG